MVRKRSVEGWAVKGYILQHRTLGGSADTNETHRMPAAGEVILNGEADAGRHAALAVKNRDGLFEAAHGGTLFLDEIGDMPLNLQARILRVIQDGEVKPLGSNTARQVDVRIVSATHSDLAQRMREGRFRRDLYFRIAAPEVHIPPLRSRIDDLVLLRQYFQREDPVSRDSHRSSLGLRT